MPTHFALEAVLGLGPVLLFLLGLLYLDSFKLVGFSTVAGVLLLGALTGVASYFISGPIMDALHVDFPHYSRYIAPTMEESLKAAAMIYLFARNRIGFMVDAAILGVAVGAGFSLFENVYYAYVFPDANVLVWSVRGFGTAIMHGGVAAVFGVSAQALSQRHATFNPLNYVPGLLLAIALHTLFNLFVAWPFQSTAATIVVLPMVLLFVFDKSEHEVHNWLVHDYESHEHLLEDIETGKFTHSEAGRFISDLAGRFSNAVVADIFAYLKLHTELVIRAEQLLLARESGKDIVIEPVDREHFVTLRKLERKIGKTAMLTIWPHLKFSHQELWELHQLESRVVHRA
jgi:RsiW-degrading membrane proteinase PrsW (M82 family)